MTRYFITELKIEGFRGINNEGDPLIIPFKDDRVNSIFAPNAQGKSSIFEALCFLVKGYVPKLSVLHASESAADYYANLFHSQSTATIEMTLQPDDGSDIIVISVVRNADGTKVISSPSGYDDPEQLLASLDNEFCLLDHRRFQNFVEDSPLGRGRSFSALLGLSAISEMRQALEVLSNTGTMNRDLNITSLRAQRSTLTQRKLTLEAQTRTSYSKLTGQPLTGQIDPTLIVHDSTLVLQNVALLSPIMAGHTILDASFDIIRQRIHDTERSDLQNQLRTLSSRIVELQSLAPIQIDIDEFESVRSLAEQLAGALAITKGPLLKANFETAIRVLESKEWSDPNICPTCDLPQREPLATKLKDKLAQYVSVNSLGTQISNLWAAGHLSQKINDLFSTRTLDIQQTNKHRFNSVATSIRNGQPTLAQVDELATLWNDAELVRETALKQAEEDRNKVHQSLPPSLVSLTEQVAFAEQICRQLKELSTVDQQLADLSAKLEIRDRWVRFVEYGTAAFGEAEVSLSTAKTTDLEQQYQSMYRSITNNSAIVPRLVKATGTEDLYLTLGEFYGLTNLAAPAILAESYRNALALSIFLSAALESKTLSSFIVLDDVTSSFDAGHQFALMELIRTRIAHSANPVGPQVILLSHDSLLEKYFDRIASEIPWFHQRIQGLAPHGAVFTQAQDANRIRVSATQFLGAGQIDQAIPLVRQYLEFKLLEIIRKANIPVPIDFSIREDKRVVQNCLDAIKNAVDVEHRAGSLLLSDQQKQQLTTILVPSLVGNWISHYSTGTGATFTPHVLLGVIDTIDLVADCFKYNCNCTGNIRRRYYKTLSSKHCAC